VSTSEERLRVAYERIAERLTGWNAVVEPFESVATVYRHRAYWKPAQVKVVLLAESHLFTPAKELANTVDLSAFGYPEAPREYARFVYCLGYGEDGIVQGRVVKNAGTWQFWRLFHACLNGAPEGETFASVLKNGTPDVSARIRNKLAVLSEMKRRGIWLVDSSLVALYVPQEKKASSRSMDWAIQESWRTFWRDELVSAADVHAICIGIGVRGRLGEELDGFFRGGVSPIEQPNAYLTGEKHFANLQACGRICAERAPR
jgi:hypothetical protein